MTDINEEVQPYVTADGVIKTKPVVRNADGEIVPDPSWSAFLQKVRRGVYEEKLLAGPIPMMLNLGEDIANRTPPGGWALIYEDHSGKKRIEIELDRESSDKLGDLVAVFDLKALGFAGVKSKQKGR